MMQNWIQSYKGFPNFGGLFFALLLLVKIRIGFNRWLTWKSFFYIPWLWNNKTWPMAGFFLPEIHFINEGAVIFNWKLSFSKYGPHPVFLHTNFMGRTSLPVTQLGSISKYYILIQPQLENFEYRLMYFLNIQICNKLIVKKLSTEIPNSEMQVDLAGIFFSVLSKTLIWGQNLI